MKNLHLHRPVGPLCLAAALLAGCSGDQPGQLEPVQAFARLLRSKAPRQACAALVPALQDEINCDSVVVPLLHYSPGFAGSKISRGGKASGWRLSKRVVLPVHYEGADGKGDVQVTLQKVGVEWRIAMAAPVLPGAGGR